MSKRNRKSEQSAPVAAEPVVVATPAAEPVAAEPVAAEPKALPTRSIVPAGYRERCHHDKEKRTAKGNVSVDNGDALAAFLRGRTVEDVAAICERAYGVEGMAKSLLAKYAHLNVGQQRMNIGNRIRSAVKDGLWSVPTQA